MRHCWLFAVLATAGCSMATMHGDTLRTRASFDMQCPREQLHVTEIDGTTAGVEGCGQRGTYIYNRPGDTWVLNSPGSNRPESDTPSGSVSPPPAAAAPPPATSGTAPSAPPRS